MSREICVGIKTLKLAPSDRLDHLRLKGCIWGQISKNNVTGRSSQEKGVRIMRTTPHFKTTGLVHHYRL